MNTIRSARMAYSTAESQTIRGRGKGLIPAPPSRLMLPLQTEIHEKSLSTSQPETPLAIEA